MLMRMWICVFSLNVVYKTRIYRRAASYYGTHISCYIYLVNTLNLLYITENHIIHYFGSQYSGDIINI